MFINDLVLRGKGYGKSMDKNKLVMSMQEIGYRTNTVSERELPNGKKFVRLDFEK